jgi:tRNA nucleotidyltransferase (CCA-adding enzyme)
VKNPNLIGKLRAQLSVEAQDLLDALQRLAEKRGAALYLVGGPLRDLLLGRPSIDLDIAVEGDAMALAREIANAIGGRAVTHPAFLTATVRIPGFHLDLITARSETYARPGDLPTVRPATIHEDLLRRDFTINALALHLNGPDEGEILDPTGGLADLDARRIRTLHERSFQDDATRILRAFRYAVRLGFEIEPETLACLKRDLPYLDPISSARLHHEFARILVEETPEETLSRLHEAGVLAAIHPALRFERDHAEAFARLRDLTPTGSRAAYWPVLAWRLSEGEAAALARRLALTRGQRVAVEAMPTLDRLASPPSSVAQGPSPEPSLHDPHLKRSAIAEMLSPFPLPALWALAALADDPTVRDCLLDYLTSARHERPHLTGDDLLALGVPRGPELGEILSRLRGAKLDGEIISRQDEETYVQRMLAGKSRVPSRSS